MVTTLAFAMMLTVMYKHLSENFEWVAEPEPEEDVVFLNPDGTLPEDE